MKTTIDIQDDLTIRARRHAERSGQSLRTVVEAGLRLVLNRYRLPDRSVGDPDAGNPLETLSWQDLRSHVYGEP